jgi:RNA polymerase sigma-70 factor (ECF subfamily)
MRRTPVSEATGKPDPGDPSAIADLVRANASAIWRVCAVLVDPDTAEDLVQETFVQAIRSLPTFRGDAPIVHWLLSIARRVCAAEIKRRQRERRLVTRLASEPANWTMPASTGTVELADALLRLPQPRLEAFLLTAVAGLSYAEAADVCDCPIGTIRSRVGRARADLEQALLPPPQRLRATS